MNHPNNAPIVNIEEYRNLRKERLAQQLAAVSILRIPEEQVLNPTKETTNNE